MDTVIITGAGGEPALSIAKRLCGLGIRVYALAGTFPETPLGKDEFVPVVCDPTSPHAVISAVQNILDKEKHIVGIILAGQFLSEDSFEAVSPEEICGALNARVIAPLCAVRLALPALISGRGNVVVVSPGSGNSEGKALNAVADAATRAFAESLFEELRDTGVKTCHILLQNNTGAPDPAALFTTAPQSRVHADIVADAVETVFRLRENNALTQMILRPQATRETPRIPISSEPKIRSLQIVQLPPAKNFPPEEEPIPTPAYRRPDYAPAKKERIPENDNDGFSDDYVDPELRYLVKDSQPHPRADNPPPADGNAEAKPRPEHQPNAPREGKNRRRNRNRNKNKKRSADGAIRVNAPRFESAASGEPEKSASPEPSGTQPSEPQSEKPQPPSAEKIPDENVPAKKREKRPPRPEKPREKAGKADNAEKPKRLPRPPKKRKPATPEKPDVPA